MRTAEIVASRRRGRHVILEVRAAELQVGGRCAMTEPGFPPLATYPLVATSWGVSRARPLAAITSTHGRPQESR